MSTIRATCPYCKQAAVLVTGMQLYPHMPSIAPKLFWRCAPCDAHVGCHQRNRRFGYTGMEPLGRLANAELRQWKQRAHEVFDPMWKHGDMTRVQAYQWLAQRLQLSEAECHIGEFDVDGCRAVVELMTREGVKA